MLAEQLIKVGATIKQANTDGLFYVIKRSNLEKVQKVYKE